MIEAVLFDMDGVLVDSEPFHDEVNLVLLRRFGVAADQSVTNPFIGRTSEALWTAMKEKFSLPLPVPELIELQWQTALANLPESKLAPSSGLRELIVRLHEQGIRMTVASSSRGSFVEAMLRHLGLWEDMEGFTCGEEPEHGKPAPDIFLLAAAKLGVAPERCLVIEDSTAGVAAGRSAGMFTVGYRNPTSDGQDVTSATRVVNDLRDVIAIIDECNAKA